MLKSIRLQNFFGFQDCTINLEKGANVLVGINGSGKSNFFKAVKLLKEGIAGKGYRKTIFEDFGGLENMFFGRNDVWSSDITFELYFDKVFPKLKNSVKKWSKIEFKIAFAMQPNFSNYTIYESISFVDLDNVRLEMLENKVSLIAVNEDEEFKEHNLFPIAAVKDITESALQQIDLLNWQKKIISKIKEIEIFEIFDTSKSSLIRRPYLGRLESNLNSDGSNVGIILNQIKNLDRISYLKIQEKLNSINPNYIGVEFFQVAGTVELRLAEAGLNKTTTASNISDGTLKFLCLMAILYNPNRGAVICIDEPELGLHPDMINTLYEAIIFASETSQIIISTHSAHLLDYFELTQIRVFDKNENNATEVNQYTEKDYEGWYETFYPGHMWRAGDIGGNRW